MQDKHAPAAGLTFGPKPSRSASPPYRISVRDHDGYTVHVKEDGYDYLGLYEKLRRNEIPVKTLLYDDPEHFVYLVEVDGRAMVYKRFGELDGKFDTKLWRFLAGPFYSNLMRTVNKAACAGYDVVPDMYLVAERIENRLSYDNYLITEFMQGTCMDIFEDLVPYRKRMAAAFIKMHRHGLALGNVKAGNLVLADDGRVKIIDLSSRGTQLTGKAKDAIKTKRLWNINLPTTSFFDYIGRASVGAQLWFTRTRRAIKAKLREKKR